MNTPKPNKNQIGKNYRLLKMDEVIIEGDEYFGSHDSCWHTTGDYGKSATPSRCSLFYRRRLPSIMTLLEQTLKKSEEVTAEIKAAIKRLQNQ